MFITFEGADGSGKSTQVKFAQEYLTGLGYTVEVTRDPGGTDLGLMLREILLNYRGDLSSLSEMFIFLADRAQHVETKIKPLLAKGVVVLCDRYIDSTLAYQGYGRGLSKEAIEYMNTIATQNLKPDLTLLFDVSTEVSMQRVEKSGDKDRLESEAREFHQKVVKGYLTIANNNPERFSIINANLDIEKVSKQVKEAIDSKLTLKAR